MLTPTWQMDVFIYETLILMPIYILILLGFVISREKHKAFRTPYYTLLVSQGLADISTITIFSSLIAARYFSIGNQLIYSLSPYSAIAYTNSGPFMFTSRCYGVFLISTQRFLTVCRSSGTLNYRLNHCPPILLGLGHWLLAFLIYLPALLNSDAYFENEITLFTVASPRHQQVFSITVISSFFTVGLSIIYMYSRIFIVMIRARKVSQSHRLSNQKSSKKLRDARLTLHIFILVIFCFIGFFYYIGEFILATEVDRSNVKAFRLFYPTVSGNLSFINPIMLLTLNKDVQFRIGEIFCWCSRKQSQSSLSIAPIQKVTNERQLATSTI